ncbi:MAG: (2Fe-2S) ferredoxin domain-containing protein [Planctomycetes bacterium]|nr:(2Fe-2S) ferredoxin domain-containing protein [Planctomycetota bacterium]
MREMPRAPYERTLFVCCNEREPGQDACANRGSAEIQKRLKEIVKSKGLQGRLRVSRAMCLGLCSVGPNLCVMPDNVWYTHVTLEDVPAIVERHVAPLEDSRNPSI